MWKTMKLDEIVSLSIGKTPSRGNAKFWDKEKISKNIWLSIADLSALGGLYIEDSKEYVSDEGAKLFKTVPSETLLMSFKLSIGKLAITKCELRTNEAIAALPIKDEKLITKEYLYYFLSSIDWDALAGNDVKVKGKTLNKAKLKEISISYPPLAEQQRIVAKLDAAFTEIDTAIEAAEQNVENISALFDSSLELCLTGGGATFSDIFLSDTSFVNIIDGDRGTNYPKKSEFLDDGFCLFLNTKNVLKDGFNFDNKMFITAEKDALLRKGKLMREDVVLTTRGTIGNIGHYSQDIEFENIRINSGMVILRANPVNISPNYLFEILRSRTFKVQVEKLQKGAAQQHIPIKTLYEINLPVPNSLEEQNKIIQKIRAHQNQVKALAILALQRARELKALKSAILAQALQPSQSEAA